MAALRFLLLEVGLVSSVEAQAARTAAKAAVRLGTRLVEASRREDLLQTVPHRV
jgi:hypothetical protein